LLHFSSLYLLHFRTPFLLGFEVLTAVSMKIAVFWVVAPCSLVEVYQRFRGPCYLHHQGESQQTAIFAFPSLQRTSTRRTSEYCLGTFTAVNLFISVSPVECSVCHYSPSAFSSLSFIQKVNALQCSISHFGLYDLSTSPSSYKIRNHLVCTLIYVVNYVFVCIIHWAYIRKYLSVNWSRNRSSWASELLRINGQVMHTNRSTTTEFHSIDRWIGPVFVVSDGPDRVRQTRSCS
jgi:hypothetical protein